MIELRRHRLVRPGTAGWDGLLSGARDDSARACLSHWAAQHLPLVVTRQPDNLPAGLIALGLPAPAQWERRRLALQLPLRSVLSFDDFPLAADVVEQLPRHARAGWLLLCTSLERQGISARVYGSHGWQHLTRLSYLHPDSDLDLRLDVKDSRAADAAVALLSDTAIEHPRLDGELAFPDGRDIAWREWRQWRQGQVERMLVKRLHSVALESGAAASNPPAAPAGVPASPSRVMCTAAWSSAATVSAADPGQFIAMSAAR